MIKFVFNTQALKFYHSNKNLINCCFFCIISLGYYYNVIDINFASDDFDSLYKHQTIGFDIFKKQLNDSFFLPVTYLFQYFEISLFGNYPICYHFTHILLHGVNAYLFYKVLHQLVQTIGDSFSRVPIYTSLFFLAYPYQTEAVVWIACSAYLLATFFGLLSIYYYVSFVQQSRIRDLYFSYLFLFIGLLCKEILIILPVILLMHQVFFEKNLKTKLLITMKACVVIFLYCLVRYITLGTLIGHYGASVHLNYNPFLLLKNTVAYLSKFFLGYRYLPEFVRASFRIIYHSPLSIFIVVLIVTGGIAYLYFRNSNIKPIKIISFIFICFLISLIPVINLETSFLGDLQSDRYGYFPSLFFCVLLSVLINSLFNNIFKQIVFTMLLGLFSYHTIQTNQIWQTSSNISDSLINCFKDSIEYKNPICIVNMPDNYKGAYIFRNSFQEALRIIYPNRKFNRINVLSWQNIHHGDGNLITYHFSNDSLIFAHADQKNYFMRFNQDNDLPILQANQTKIVLKKTDIKYALYVFNNKQLEKIEW